MQNGEIIADSDILTAAITMKCILITNKNVMKLLHRQL